MVRLVESCGVKEEGGGPRAFAMDQGRASGTAAVELLGHIGAVLANLCLTHEVCRRVSVVLPRFLTLSPFYPSFCLLLSQGREAVSAADAFPLLVSLSRSSGDGTETMVLSGLAGLANASESMEHASYLLTQGALEPVCKYGGGCGGGAEDAQIADFACTALGHMLHAGAGGEKYVYIYMAISKKKRKKEKKSRRGGLP